MKFFFDNCVAPQLAMVIQTMEGDYGNQVTHLRDRFPVSVTDSEWIKTLGNEGQWIVVSGDFAITRKKVEKVVWKHSGLIGFFFKENWMNHDEWDQAWRLVKWWPYIVKQAKLAAPGSSYAIGVNPNGKFKTI